MTGTHRTSVIETFVRRLLVDDDLDDDVLLHYKMTPEWLDTTVRNTLRDSHTNVATYLVQQQKGPTLRWLQLADAEATDAAQRIVRIVCDVLADHMAAVGPNVWYTMFFRSGNQPRDDEKVIWDGFLKLLEPTAQYKLWPSEVGADQIDHVPGPIQRYITQCLPPAPPGDPPTTSAESTTTIETTGVDMTLRRMRTVSLQRSFPMLLRMYEIMLATFQRYNIFSDESRWAGTLATHPVKAAYFNATPLHVQLDGFSDDRIRPGLLIKYVHAMVDSMYGRVWTRPSQRPEYVTAVTKTISTVHWYFRWLSVRFMTNGVPKDHTTKWLQAGEYIKNAQNVHQMRTVVLYLLVACRMGLALLDFHFHLSANGGHRPQAPSRWSVWDFLFRGRRGTTLHALEESVQSVAAPNLFALFQNMDRPLYGRLRATTLMYERFLWKLFCGVEKQHQGRVLYANAAIRVVRSCERVTTLKRRLYRWYRHTDTGLFRPNTTGLKIHVHTPRILTQRRFGTIQEAGTERIVRPKPAATTNGSFDYGACGVNPELAANEVLAPEVFYARYMQLQYQLGGDENCRRQCERWLKTNHPTYRDRRVHYERTLELILEGMSPLVERVTGEGRCLGTRSGGLVSTGGFRTTLPVGACPGCRVARCVVSGWVNRGGKKTIERARLFRALCRIHLPHARHGSRKIFGGRGQGVLLLVHAKLANAPKFNGPGHTNHGAADRSTDIGQRRFVVDRLCKHKSICIRSQHKLSPSSKIHHTTSSTRWCPCG